MCILCCFYVYICFVKLINKRPDANLAITNNLIPRKMKTANRQEFGFLNVKRKGSFSVESTIKIWSKDWSKSIEIPEEDAPLIKSFKHQIKKILGEDFQWELSWGLTTHFLYKKNGLIQFKYEKTKKRPCEVQG